jgi:hypothetical protein
MRPFGLDPRQRYQGETQEFTKKRKHGRVRSKLAAASRKKNRK